MDVDVGSSVDRRVGDGAWCREDVQFAGFPVELVCRTVPYAPWGALAGVSRRARARATVGVGGGLWTLSVLLASRKVP